LNPICCRNIRLASGLATLNFSTAACVLNLKLVHVKVSNTGDAAGSEVVQLYVSDLAASVTRPELALKGFSKIRLLPGESRTVTFPLNREHLELVGMDLRRVVEPGEFIVRVGSHSAATVSCSLTVRESGVQ
jgi:beta-glucosidase